MNRSYAVDLTGSRPSVEGDYRVPGIYAMSGVNRVVGADHCCLYVGSSVRVGERLCGHVSRLKCALHSNPILQSIWTKYGVETFTKVMLEECPTGSTPEHLIQREQAWIDYYVDKHGANSLINIQLEVQLLPSQTPEARAKLSAAAKRLCAEGRSNVGIRGVPRSEATKAKIREKAYGRGHSEEARAKMRQSHLGQIPIHSCKRVAQIDPNTEQVVHVFPSLSEASRKTRADKNGISLVCRGKPLKGGGKARTCGGFKWRFVASDDTLIHPNEY